MIDTATIVAVSGMPSRTIWDNLEQYRRLFVISRSSVRFRASAPFRVNGLSPLAHSGALRLTHDASPGLRRSAVTRVRSVTHLVRSWRKYRASSGHHKCPDRRLSRPAAALVCDCVMSSHRVQSACGRGGRPASTAPSLMPLRSSLGPPFSRGPNGGWRFGWSVARRPA